MENKINIFEILKDCNKGTKLYCTMFGECRYDRIYNVPDQLISVIHVDSNLHETETLFDEYGLLLYEKGECLLFPSKDYRSWEGVRVKYGELIIPEKPTYGKYYCYGDLNKSEEIKAEFFKYGARDACCYNYIDNTLYYIDNIGCINYTDNRAETEKLLIFQGYKKLELSNQPEDKELVWCYDKCDEATHILGFFDAKNHCIFTYRGERNGTSYKYYEPYGGEYPDWAKEALKHLED